MSNQKYEKATDLYSLSVYSKDGQETIVVGTNDRYFIFCIFPVKYMRVDLMLFVMLKCRMMILGLESRLRRMPGLS